MTTSPSADDAPASPFSGCRVHTLIGVDIEDGAPQPWFDDECWMLTGVRGLPVQVRPDRVTWDFAAIANPAWRMVAREFLIAMLAPRHDRVLALPAARREPIAVITGYNRLQTTIGWFRWLSEDDVGWLREVTQEHCDPYLIERLESGASEQRMMAEVAVLKDLARYGELFTTDRYPHGFEPWPGKSAAAVAGVSSSATGNTTPVVPEHILRPALHAALYLVDCIGPRLVDLLDRLRARQAEPTVHGWPSEAELETAMAERVANRCPLPQADAKVVRERLADGWAPDDPLLQLSLSEFFRALGRRPMISSYLDRARPLLADVARAVGFAPCWERDAVEVDRADGAGRVPWTVPLTSQQATDLPFAVFNACLFVVAALSGMRASELMELTTQSCPPPRQHGEALFRYSLASRRIKGEKLGGVADEWVVIEPAYRAVELATRLSHSEKGMSHFRPEASIFGRFEFPTRFNTFRRWVNSPAGARLGLHPIPAGHVNARMLRRTLALELAHRPHGLFAAKIHLKHISVATTEGYAHRPGGSQAKFHAEMVAEEQAHRRELAVEAYRDYQSGIRPAGPGAKALLSTFAFVDDELAQLARVQPTVVATDRHVELLLKRRADTLRVQPANYCWFTDPAKALCLKLAGNPAATAPLAGLCDAARCPQATFHPRHRPVWESSARHTETFLGNPRVPAGEKRRLAAEHDRALSVLNAIDNATEEPS